MSRRAGGITAMGDRLRLLILLGLISVVALYWRTTRVLDPVTCTTVTDVRLRNYQDAERRSRLSFPAATADSIPVVVVQVVKDTQLHACNSPTARFPAHGD